MQIQRRVGLGVACGAAIIAAGLGCSPRTDIGVDPSSGGSAGAAPVLPEAGDGNAPMPGGGGRGSEPSEGCFDPFGAFSSSDLQRSANNQVFGKPTTVVAPLNHAEQVVFERPVWKLSANFPASAYGTDTELELPGALSVVPDNVGEVHIARNACRGEQVAGRTVKVELWWQLNSAIVDFPSEGLALGTIGGDSFADATISYVRGQPEEERALNRLESTVLQHTFAATDEFDPADLVLRVWLLDTFEFSSTVYVSRVEWL